MISNSIVLSGEHLLLPVTVVFWSNITAQNKMIILLHYQLDGMFYMFKQSKEVIKLFKSLIWCYLIFDILPLNVMKLKTLLGNLIIGIRISIFNMK